ncbi:MAG: ribonuclease P protein component [Pseudomonadota bacterium]|nr:ribonuclease P protein component [Pseudomonadota bacterium]
MPTGILPLKQRAQFLHVAAARRYFVAPSLLLQVCLNSEAGKTIRVGYTASRRVGNAVVRNRAKRRLRAAVEEVMPSHGVLGCDYVIIARLATTKQPFHAIQADLKTAMKKLNVWRKAGVMASQFEARGK